MTVTVEDRLGMVKRFDLDQCRAALETPNLQKTVRTAIERRMRKLQASTPRNQEGDNA